MSGIYILFARWHFIFKDIIQGLQIIDDISITHADEHRTFTHFANSFLHEHIQQKQTSFPESSSFADCSLKLSIRNN